MATQIDMIGMNVKDMAASMAFYRLLGLEIPNGVEKEPYAEVITPNGYRISWNQLEMVKSINPDWVEPVGHRMELAFKCDSPAEVDALHQKMVSAGYVSQHAPYDAFWGQHYATIIDPDGNLVDLFSGL